MKYLSLLLMAIISQYAVAQQGEHAVMHVVYQFSHVYDLENPSKPYTAEVLLTLGQTESRYGANHRPQAAKLAQQLKARAAGGGAATTSLMGVPAAVVNSKPTISTEIFQQVEKKALNTAAILGMQGYLIEGAMPLITWKLYEEKKKLGNYVCQKAVGEYAGRVYTAWFAPELPFRNGPWKLSGLPGLILEAEDSKKEVQFIFKELDKATEDESTASVRGSMLKMVKIKPKAFARLEKVYNQDPTAGFQAQLPANGPKVVTVFVDENGRTTSGQEATKMVEQHRKILEKKKQNPLELIKVD